MLDLEKEVRRRYLDRPDEFDPEDPRMDFGEAALPYFVAAFKKETSVTRRVRLTEAIWQFRTVSALPALAIALRDPFADVWKESLDGFATIGGDQARSILEAALDAIPPGRAGMEKREWIEEALIQIKEGYGQKREPPPEG